MIEAQDRTVVWITDPAAIVNNAAVTTAEINTIQNGVKYDYVEIYFRLGATDTALTTLKVQESDTTGSGFTDIPGASIAPLPLATDDNKTYGFFIDMRGRKSILDLSVVIGNGAAGAFTTAVAILSRAKESPDTPALRGLAAQVIL